MNKYETRGRLELAATALQDLRREWTPHLQEALTENPNHEKDDYCSWCSLEKQIIALSDILEGR